MKSWNIALGFYQELSTANAVAEELKKHKCLSFALIYNKGEGATEIKRHFPLSWIFASLMSLFVVICLCVLNYLSLITLSRVEIGIIATLLLGVAGYYSYGCISKIIDWDIINRFKNSVLANEILILVQLSQKDVREVLSVLRQVKSGHPISYLLRSDLRVKDNIEMAVEPLTIEQLRSEAAQLANSLQKSDKSNDNSQPLLKRLEESNKMLLYLRQDVANAEYIEQTIPLSAEWLLDNMYVIEGSIEEVKRNLPRKFYKKLPKILNGPLAGFPRIYAIAIELIKGTAGRLSSENITNFLESYQKNNPLTIGELWALPLMLNLRLIEWIQCLSINIDNRIREGEFARFWGNRLLYAARHEPERLALFLSDLSNEQKFPSAHFTEELLDHLFDEEAVLPQVRKWLEGYYMLPLADVLHQEQIYETSEQIVFSNCVRSLITLSQLSWQNIFESVSPVDAILREDPVGIYSNMDFKTRNQYREALESIARRTNFSEVEIAKQILNIAHSGKTEVEKHVGYYLIDLGRRSLEKKVNSHPTFLQTIHREITKNATKVYLGGIFILTLTVETLLFSFLLHTKPSFSITLLFVILSLLPSFELCVQFMNLLLTMILPTNLLPRMSFEAGLSEKCKTLVVVPMMLHTPESIKEELHRLEIRYLANSDRFISFSLFSDFKDAEKQHTDADAVLLEVAVSGIKALQEKYGTDQFFLFHRQRVWSESENTWMGWERKRGKLEYLNRFLKGEALPENILYAGKMEPLKDIRYVITLDSDTQLPKDQAKALIEIIAHPLNKAYLSADGKKIIRGYGIIQPRVLTDFTHSKSSWFCRIFSEPAAVDPYTQAISNIYQDLVGEGSYHGKGIYDVDAFHSVLSHRFPKEHLLSHDLIEGAYVHVGFASNVCLFDLHPDDYLAWIKRKHRWMRGDWQIIDWLFSLVPTENGKEKNPLFGINQWKIFDNLRRALLPISLLLLLICAWIVSPTAGIWTALTAGVLLMPILSLVVNTLFNFSFVALKNFFKELNIAFLRLFITAALLPFEAFQAMDALIRVLYRRCISHKNLIQWTPSDSVYSNQKQVHQKFIFQLGLNSLFGLGVFWLISILNPYVENDAFVFCFVWLMAPFVIYAVDKPLSKRSDKGLTDENKKILRKIARKTWRYFDDLIGPQTNWLPPDNYQTALKIEIAQRTSPTNIGMWLLASLSAYDFRYVTCDTVINETLATLQMMKKLERYEGHLLNWYNIQTLEPLFPRYISTVDSGNLLACLWTLKEGMFEIISAPIIPSDPLSGVLDSYELFQETKIASKLEAFNLNEDLSDNLPLFIATVKNSLKIIQEFYADMTKDSQSKYWVKQIKEQLEEWDTLISRYFAWVEILTSLSTEEFINIDTQALMWRDLILSLKPSLRSFSSGEFTQAFNTLFERAQRSELSDKIKGWVKKLKESLSTSQWLAGEKLGLVDELISEVDQFTREMNLNYLYDKERKLFAIGYNVDDKKLDSSHYDLLASEARIASLVGIANEDVPLEHWWALGRFYGVVERRKVLLSWGGTMFEYLMPLLFNKQYKDSLLGNACDAVVACQIEYGHKRGIPWGISESAFSAIDSHKIYQYKSFGIPGIGLKRGLEEDLVVSPYSSALALAIDPKSAVKNLEKLSEIAMGPYGYYDAIDFTRQNNPAGERGVIVYTYMVHHQGMILGAVNNTLNDDVLIKRFHNDPRICGVNSLLYERIPASPAIKVRGGRKEASLTRLKPFSQTPVMGVVKTPESVTPKINLLSNENYSLMITNTGGGYSRWRGIDITRWRADTTQDAWGCYFYIKDIKSGNLWSATHQPTQNSSKEYSVNFKPDKSEFRRKDYKIETLTEVVISPEDNSEIRLITLINHSDDIRTIEVTSYIELALAPHLTDRAHPCFNKLFIETEALPEHGGLLAFRRLRSSDDAPIWAAHVLATNTNLDAAIQYETDRNRFIGRGKTLKRPLALEGNLSNTTGTVLDPIFSLRCRVSIEPGRRVQLSFITAISDNRSTSLALIEKYKDITASQRALELAWTYAQLELRHLRVHQEEVQLFQKLAGRILYPHAQLRPVEDVLRKNRLGQSGLWPQGISGDLPILVITIGDVYDVDLVKQALVAHAFWTLRGLKVDLIILNEEENGYLNPLQDQLQNIIQSYSHRNITEKAECIFLKNINLLSGEELNLIFSVARVILVAARGSLRQQLVSPMQRIKYPPKISHRKKMGEEPSRPLPFLELPYFNGLGGYTADGKLYVIYLGPNANTPAPWINVLANPNFGTLVSEAGVGCTWYGNSQTNRLTPWSNDPVLDPIADAIYIRDEELGTVWTTTPSPIRELDAYRISHGQGFTRYEHNSHGIDQELLIFVPVNDNEGLPLRIQRLRLINRSSHRRHLTLTAYSEWVLGGDREDTQMHVITEWDSESQALFAYNRYHSDFGGHVAFTTSIGPVSSFTGNRTEFIGRNRSSSNPEGLTRKFLSGHTGAALDPCSALQALIEINPDEEAEVIFIMGYARDQAEARQLILQCRNKEKINQLLNETLAWWDKTLTTIQIDVPDLATNFLMNRWFIYQNLSCRFWGRSGFYQSSGAYGFRDQLQDTMALVYSMPHITREYILKAASRQFIEGDVQHWWHPQSGGGIRTRFSDDLLWLPFATAHYVRITGDATILEEKVPFLEGPLLSEDQHEVYLVPTVSKESESLLEHCRRALQKGITKGPHGLPLIGSGDWNDGMNRVGIKGKGESVWLAWFLMHVMNDFADLLYWNTSQKESGEGFRLEAKRLAEVVEATAWDGSWYRRAYFDDGTPIGSKENSEAFIDSLAQSWAVISGLGNPERCALGLSSAEKYLVKAKDNLVLLLTPPFDKTLMDPGYIKGYPPGVRENGGQYTHGSLWLAMAYARSGNGSKAVELLRMMSPTLHTQSSEANTLYKVEPYVVAADIYDLVTQVGRGGWTWYTGSAAWIYRIWLEEVLGFKLRGQTLLFDCNIPIEWNSFKMHYRYQNSYYDITVTNSHPIKGVAVIKLNGILLTSNEIPLANDGLRHVVEIVIEDLNDKN